MDKYIKAEDLKQEMLKKSFYPVFMKNLIEQMPAADVVEVVRCKDCKHRYEDEEWRMRCKKSWFMECTDDNYFCSYGEKRENGKEI